MKKALYIKPETSTYQVKVESLMEALSYSERGGREGTKPEKGSNNEDPDAKEFTFDLWEE